MPAFTFEKIPAPVRAATPAQAKVVSKIHPVGKSRALVNQMLDRLTITRLKRQQSKLPPSLPRKPPPD